MATVMVQCQAEEDALGIRVIDGHALPCQIRQTDKPSAALRQMLYRGGEGVGASRLLLLYQIEEEGIPDPADQGAGRVGTAGNAVVPGTV